MKKKLLLVAVATFFLSFTLESVAQSRASTSGNVHVGYAKYDAQIWEYDGYSLPYDAKVGGAILLTRSQLEPYIGGTIVGMRVGWDTSTQQGTYNGFVRKTFNGEDLATGKATVKYSYSDSNPGWNDMTLTSYVIPEDVEQLVVGFTTEVKKDVCAIPKVAPYGAKNSAYLWVEGDNDDDGNPAWRDMSAGGALPILLTIKDTNGSFNFLPTITMLYYDGVVRTDQTSSALVRMRNDGSVTISSIEVTSRQGDDVHSQKVTLSKNIQSGLTSSTFMIPVKCFRSGDLELSITKVNNQVVSKVESRTLNLIGIPGDVADKYTRRPLIEYFVSENNYFSPRYYDEYVEPGLDLYRNGEITYVSQHLDDQFMTGDDDATALMVALCDNDSSAVSVPSMAIDRAISTDNISYQLNAAWNPTFATLIGTYWTNLLEASLGHPTFLSVEASGLIADNGEDLTVSVGGELADAEAVMPEGEKMRVTVYLMESNVESDSQIFWTEKEKEAYMGAYEHVNVIREVLSDPKGDVIENPATWTGSYHTTLDPTWNRENLYIVAFMHRDGKKGGWFMHVFNSTEGRILDASGINEIGQSDSSSMVNGQCSIVYDLQGRRANHAAKGIFIHNGKKVIIR